MEKAIVAEVLSAPSDQNGRDAHDGDVPAPDFAAPPSGDETVRALYDALLSTMKEGRTLGRD
jgi:hypothetical protein